MRMCRSQPDSLYLESIRRAGVTFENGCSGSERAQPVGAPDLFLALTTTNGSVTDDWSDVRKRRAVADANEEASLAEMTRQMRLRRTFIRL